MEELAPERSAIKAALEELEIDGWLFDKDAGARPQTIQQTFLEEVGRSDLYIGLFWRGYGDYTIEQKYIDAANSNLNTINNDDGTICSSWD